MKLKHPILIYILTTTLIVLVALVLLLDAYYWYFDPAGVVAYAHDYNELQSHASPVPSGERYAPGFIDMRVYDAIIDINGFRAVPNSRGGDCRIVFVGDSVTWGMGSDSSFVDILAPDLPATVINAGYPAYSAENVRDEIEAIPADGYIYLIIDNDDETRFVWQAPSGNMPTSFELYRRYFSEQRPPVATSLEAFRAATAAILSRPDVLAFTFRAGHLVDVIEREFPQVHVIPMYTKFVSAYDLHPSEDGHLEIADSMRSAVISFVTQRCKSM